MNFKRIIYSCFIVLGFYFLFAQEPSGSISVANADSLKLLKKRFENIKDSLTVKKKQTLEKVEKNIFNLISKQSEIKNYKKEELVANLIYKLAYYYRGAEESEALALGNKLDELYAEYSPKFEGVEQTKYEDMYLAEIEKLAPNILENYEDEYVLSSQPSGLYKPEYRKTMEYFQKIIDDYPTSTLVPNAYYNVAYLLYDMGRKDESIGIYEKIIKFYPNSDFYADANFSIGEYYFDPELNPSRDTRYENENMKKAISYYEAILKENDEDYRYKALYRIGFCYYRLFKYDVSAAKLTELVEKLYDKYGLAFLPNDMRLLSMQFLAYTFRDRLWGDDAKENSAIVELKKYIDNRRKNNMPALSLYGNRVFNNLGEIYHKGEEFNLAIESYDTLLSMYPNTPEAPEIQKKIIAIFQEKPYDNEDERSVDLYRERNQLFAAYRLSSEWGDKNKKMRDSLKTDELLSENLYSNIRYMQDLAQSKNDKKLYETTIGHIDEYVSGLPADSNTYKLKWWKTLLLEQRLTDYYAAYKMYIDISRDSLTKNYYDKDSKRSYTDTLAALQAIKVADVFKKSVQAANYDSLRSRDINLSFGDLKHVEAFRNYADLFPNSLRSPVYLFDAAKIYHANKEYAENKKLLNEIIDKYHGSDQEALAYDMLYREYFDEGNYAEAEKATKKMEALSTLTAEQKGEIIQRKFGAIYKQAEVAESGAGTTDSTKSADELNIKAAKLKNSADEFMRAARENPDYKDAPMAVWNASYNYSLAREWDSVKVAYDLLISRYKGMKSKDGLDYAAVSLGNLAYLVTDTLTKYKYTGPLFTSKKANNKQAALYLEKFSQEYPNFMNGTVDQTKRVVQDAAYFYKESEEWESAIRMNRLYLDKYAKGDSEEMNVDRLRDMAKLNMRLGREVEAFKIYQELGLKYPSAPFAVEGFYQRAKFYLSKNDKSQAKLDYEKCYQSSKTLQNKGIKDFGSSYASEALFFLTEIELTNYLQVALNTPLTKADLDKQKKLKLDAAIRLNNKYQEIMNYFGKEYGIASLRKAEILENNADAIFNQKRFKDKTILDDLGNEEAICKESETAYNLSLDLYTTSIREIDDFARIYQQSVKNSISTLDSLVKLDSTNTDLLSRKREFLNDTTIAFTLKFRDQAKVSVLKMQYSLASVYKKLASAYAGLTPQDLEYKSAEDLGYFDEMFDTHINQMVKPKISSIVEAHQKTLLFAKEYKLLNNEWAVKSRNEITRSADVIVDAYSSLLKRLIGVYQRTDNHVKELNAQKMKKDGDGLVIPPKKTVNGEKVDVITIHDNMLTIIDYLGKTLENSAQNYENNLAAAKSNLNKIDFDGVKRSYLQDILNIAQSLDSLIAYNNSRQGELSRDIDKRADLAELYDMGDKEVYKAQAKEIEARILDMYGVAYDKIKEYSIDNDLSSTILYQLLTRKPSDYYEDLGFKSIDHSIITDLTWKTIPVDQEGWTRIDFDTKDWVVPDSVTAVEKVLADSILKANKSVSIWSHFDPKFNALKSKKIKKNDEDDDSGKEERQIYWFRKDFDLKTIPILGEAYIAVDDRFGLLVNEETVFDMFLNGDDMLDDDSLGWNKARKYKITNYLRQGKNSLVLFAMDLKEPHNGLNGYFKIQALDKPVATGSKLKVISDTQVADEKELQIQKNIRIFKKNRLE